MNGHNTYMEDINKFTFTNMYEKLEYKLDSHPLFLTIDGSLLMYE
jgi:hypothetical protein